MSDDTAIQEALTLEEAGDKLAGEGRLGDALDAYRHAERLNPNRGEIYVKLIDTHERLKASAPEAFAEDDMADLLTWTMRAQELATPRLRYLHRYLSGEDKTIHRLLQRLMATEDDQEEGYLLEQIEAQGVQAVQALLYFFVSLKHTRAQTTDS